MAQQYTKEQLWKIYDTLPKELKEAVFSNENAEHIFETCERNGVQEVSRVAAEVGNVLMGVTLPKDFQAALEKEAELKPAVAQSVAQDINRFVFFPVKEQLEQIHRQPGEGAQQQEIGVATPRHSERVGVADQAAEPSFAEAAEGEEENGYMAEEPAESSEDIEADREPKRGPDQYREPIE